LVFFQAKGARMGRVEPNIVAIINKAEKSPEDSDRDNALKFKNVVIGMLNSGTYFQTQLIDSPSMQFRLQPCDGSGRPVARFAFSYAHCL
jgi:hypothetical protein